jgi:hypothetical protein
LEGLLRIRALFRHEKGIPTLRLISEVSCMIGYMGYMLGGGRMYVRGSGGAVWAFSQGETIIERLGRPWLAKWAFKDASSSSKEGTRSGLF